MKSRRAAVAVALLSVALTACGRSVQQGGDSLLKYNDTMIDHQRVSASTIPDSGGMGNRVWITIRSVDNAAQVDSTWRKFAKMLKSTRQHEMFRSDQFADNPQTACDTRAPGETFGFYIAQTDARDAVVITAERCPSR